MARGVRDSVEMKGDVKLEGGDVMTRLPFVLGVHLKVMLTSLDPLMEVEWQCRSMSVTILPQVDH